MLRSSARFVVAVLVALLIVPSVFVTAASADAAEDIAGLGYTVSPSDLSAPASATVDAVDIEELMKVNDLISRTPETFRLVAQSIAGDVLVSDVTTSGLEGMVSTYLVSADLTTYTLMTRIAVARTTLDTFSAAIVDGVLEPRAFSPAEIAAAQATSLPGSEAALAPGCYECSVASIGFTLTSSVFTLACSVAAAAPNPVTGGFCAVAGTVLAIISLGATVYCGIAGCVVPPNPGPPPQMAAAGVECTAAITCEMETHSYSADTSISSWGMQLYWINTLGSTTAESFSKPTLSGQTPLIVANLAGAGFGYLVHRLTATARSSFRPAVQCADQAKLYATVRWANGYFANTGYYTVVKPVATSCA